MRAPGAAAGARYRHERALSAPTRVVDNLHGISAPTRVVDTSARYIPLAVSTTPSRCQRPPHGADNARPHRQRALELAPGPTTRVHTRGSTPRQGRARCGHGRPRPLPSETPALRPGALRTRSTWTRPTTRVHTRGSTRTRPRPQEDCSGSRTTPSEYAHKDPDLRNTHRTQGRNQALVCDSVLPNSLPCVRHQRRRTPKRNEAKGEPTVQTANLPRNRPTKPAKRPTRGERSGWPPGELRPHRPGSRARGRPAPPRDGPHPFAGTPWAPQAAAGGAAPPGEPRPHRRPTAVASPRGAWRRCHP